MVIKFVRRDDVRDRLLAKWARAIELARKVGLPYHIPDWDRLRNSELEMLMRDNFGDDGWVVCEWCPFDGIFCFYRYGASKHDLKTARNIGVSNPRNSYLFKIIDDELAKRPKELGEKQPWGKGVADYLEELEAKSQRRLRSALENMA